MKIITVGPGLNVRGGVSTVERHIVTSPEYDDHLISHISTYEDGGIGVKLWAFLKGILSLLSAIIFRKPSIIHIHFSHRGSTLRKIVLFYCIRGFSLPIVMHSHGSDFHEFYRGLPSWAKFFVKDALSRADAVIGLSGSWCDFFINEVGVSPDKVEVFNNPVEFIDTSSKRPNRTINILFLGRLEKRKGIYDILDAITKLKQENVDLNISLKLAGDGEVDKVSKIIQDRNIGDLIEVVGWVDRDTVKKLLINSEILLLPSYNEGLPMALLEAMGCGIAVITSPVGGIPEVINNNVNGLLVEPGNVDEIAQAIVKLMSEEERGRLGLAAKESTQHLSVDSYNQRLLNLYKKIIKRNK